MNNPLLSLPGFISFCTLLNLLTLLHAQREPFQLYECGSNGNYTNNDTYHTNLNTLISNLPSGLDNNGFIHASVGQIPNRANGMILCRGDIQLDVCRSCLQNASIEIVLSCPNQRRAVMWMEVCTLRYSDDPIFGILPNDAVSLRSALINTLTTSNPAMFMSDVDTLLDTLRAQAINGDSLRKVSFGTIISRADSLPIYGLVQCTPDLVRDDCDACLSNAARQLRSCCGTNLGARGLLPSCYIRREYAPFYNETRLRELVTLADTPTTTQTVPSAPPIAPPIGNGVDNNNNNTSSTIIIIVVSVLVGAIILVVVVYLSRRRKTKHKRRQDMENGDGIFESLQYDLAKIKSATNDFGESNKLGRGGFGIVYKGLFPSGQEIAVKRLSRNSGQGDLEFENEVMLLARLQHRNLVRLLGFSTEGTEKLLVYEFVQNSSLDNILFDERKRLYLNWDKRYKIIGGIAKGILYLHEDSRLRIIHRDLKASNILLDGEMNPKIADFGMARLFMQEETEATTNRIVGTYGYMAPEYAMYGQFSVKSDVYSFGVLVLEIMSGKRNSCFQLEDKSKDLVNNAWEHWEEGTIVNFLDPSLRDTEGSSSDILRCIQIGLLCVQGNVAQRPTMVTVVLMLNNFSMMLENPSKPLFSVQTDCELEASFDGSKSDSLSKNNMSITEFHAR